MDYAVLYSRATGNELIAAECEFLTGGKPIISGLAVCKTLECIPRAAYLTTGMQLIAHAPTLQALAADVLALSFSADGFRVDFKSLSEHIHVPKQAAILAIANAINGYPDLDHPQRRFLIVAYEGGFYLGEILAEAGRTYQQHDARPYRTSSSLPNQLARAMVNLTYPAQTILDPCCGTGTILLEACATGLTAFGMDRNPKMVGMTRRNLLHFGYQAIVQRGDACQCTQSVDAVVTDLPYGRFLVHDEENIRAVLRQMTTLAPLGVYLAEQNITTWLQDAGYRKIAMYQVRKRAGMTRYVHRARW